MSRSAVDHFVNKLKEVASSPTVTNFYAGDSPESRLCCENLRLYLSNMQKRKPTMLLLGEAPGYKGCRNTGIPFTSEKVLVEIPFFAGDNYQILPNEGEPSTEITASIFWETLLKYDERPLLWNIFPFHPHQAGKPDSNRTPTQSEIQLGFTFLKDLLNLFSIQYTVAVGRRAQAMLMDNNIHYIYLRHPAHGGINQFKRGMQGLFATPNPGIENNF